MSKTFFMVLHLLNSLLVSETSWFSPTSTLIRNNSFFALGTYNDSIFLVGGWGGSNSTRAIIEYQIKTDTFINIVEPVITSDIWGYSQFWAQRDETLYMIKGTTLSTFNLMNREFTANLVDYDINVAMYGCLAASDDYLFVIGGNNYQQDLDILQVMNISTNQWFNASRMQEPRNQFACIVHNDYLWAFGGKSKIESVTKYLRTNERIDIRNISSNEWKYIDSLSEGAYALRATVWQQNIFIIGGIETYVPMYSDKVYIVDGITGNVTLSSSRLVYGIGYPGVILNDNIMYAFGGTTAVVVTNKWMQYALVSINDSNNASASIVTSTLPPSNVPSEYPTLSPSNVPSQHPTLPPSNEPSQSPTLPLSNPPTQYPTFHLTTFDPTQPFTSLQYNVTPSDNDKPASSPPSTVNFMVVLGICVMGLLCICVFGFCIRQMYKKRVCSTADDINNICNGIDAESSESLVKFWLTATVGLPQYYPLFIQNGFNSLDFISKIEGVQTLKDIGITIIGHQVQIMAEIKQLKNPVAVDPEITPQNNDSDHKHEDGNGENDDNKNNDDSKSSDHENDDLWEAVEEQHTGTTGGETIGVAEELQNTTGGEIMDVTV